MGERIDKWRKLLSPDKTPCHIVRVIRSSSLCSNVNRAEIMCFRCGEMGHKKQECRSWKTRRCTKVDCPTASICAYAHTESELRHPLVARCIRVVRSEEGELIRIGCLEFGHTYKECPHSKPDLEKSSIATICPRVEEEEDDDDVIAAVGNSKCV